MITFYKIKSFSKHIKYCSSTIGSIFINNNFSMNNNVENYVENNIENKYEKNSGIWQYLNEFENIYLNKTREDIYLNKTDEEICNEIISLLPEDCVYIDKLVSIEEIDKNTFCEDISYQKFQESKYKYKKFETYAKKKNEQTEKFAVIDKLGNKYFVKLITEAEFTDSVKNEIRTLFDLEYKNIENKNKIHNINKINKVIIERDDEKKTKNYYIFTKFYEKGNLLKYLNIFHDKSRNNFFLKICKQLIDIIDDLHKEEYSHRNIRLKNILVDNYGNLILKDFKYATKGKESKDTCESINYWFPEILEVNISKYNNNNNNIQDLTETYDNKKKDIFSLGVILFSLAYKIDPQKITEEIENKIKENRNKNINKIETNIALNVLTKYLEQYEKEKEKGILNYFLYKLLCNIFCEESKRYNINEVKNSTFYQYCSFRLDNKNKINNYNNEIKNINIDKDTTYDDFIKNLILSNYKEKYSFCNESYDDFFKSEYRYVIEKKFKIGCMGGMSEQMIVIDKYDNKFFVKIIYDIYENSYISARKEIGTMLYLQGKKCKNILNILDLMADGKKYYIITKYYNNGNLHRYLKYLKDNNIDKNDDFYLNIIKQLIDCIYTLHKEGFAHRDIKPNNILVDNYEKLILADFGFATYDKKSNQNFGTQYYCSPELDYKQTYDTKKNDIFSMAVTICTIIFNITAEEFYNITKEGYEEKINNLAEKSNNKNCNISNDNIKNALIDLLKHMLCEECYRYDIDKVVNEFNQNIYSKFIKTNK